MEEAIKYLQRIQSDPVGFVISVFQNMEAESRLVLIEKLVALFNRDELYKTWKLISGKKELKETFHIQSSNVVTENTTQVQGEIVKEMSLIE